MVELNKIIARFRVNKSGDPEADFTKMMKIVENEIGLNSRQRQHTAFGRLKYASLKKTFIESVYGKGAEKGNMGIMSISSMPLSDSWPKRLVFPGDPCTHIRERACLLPSAQERKSFRDILIIRIFRR